MEQRLGDDIDLSLFAEPAAAATPAGAIADPRAPIHATMAAELCARLYQDLRDVLDFGDGRERRTWGVVNSGLCLLVAWSLESLLQQRQADS